MSRRPKLLGIETDVWALLTPEGQIRAGDYKPHIYWTRPQAKAAQTHYRECTVVAVRVVIGTGNQASAAKHADRFGAQAP